MEPDILKIRIGEISYTGETVYTLRTELMECSQEELSMVMGVSVAAVSRWENGKADISKKNENLLVSLVNEFNRDGSSYLIKKMLLWNALYGDDISAAEATSAVLINQKELFTKKLEEIFKEV